VQVRCEAALHRSAWACWATAQQRRWNLVAIRSLPLPGVEQRQHFGGVDAFHLVQLALRTHDRDAGAFVPPTGGTADWRHCGVAALQLDLVTLTHVAFAAAGPYLVGSCVGTPNPACLVARLVSSHGYCVGRCVRVSPAACGRLDARLRVNGGPGLQAW
jgi:hypothetical protein